MYADFYAILPIIVHIELLKTLLRQSEAFLFENISIKLLFNYKLFNSNLLVLNSNYFNIVELSIPIYWNRCRTTQKEKEAADFTVLCRESRLMQGKPVI